jgi:hypothetical protein
MTERKRKGRFAGAVLLSFMKKSKYYKKKKKWTTLVLKTDMACVFYFVQKNEMHHDSHFIIYEKKQIL